MDAEETYLGLLLLCEREDKDEGNIFWICRVTFHRHVDARLDLQGLKRETRREYGNSDVVAVAVL